MSTKYLFVGPTINVRRHVFADQFRVLPPVSCGDLLRLNVREGDVVAIVDGYFRERYSVRHKEILELLRRGVLVYGASSMGALRAAEMIGFGMEGVGVVFEMLVSGEIDGDDEVAVLHATAEAGYVPLSEALVNMRDCFKRAVLIGLLTTEQASMLTVLAKELPFFERTYKAVFRRAFEYGLPSALLDRIASFQKTLRSNPKEQDALALLALLTGDGYEHGPGRQREGFRNPDFYQLSLLATGSDSPEGEFVSDQQVFDICRIDLKEYESFHRRSGLRALAAIYGAKVGLSSGRDRDSLFGEFRTEYGLIDDATFRSWLNERMLTCDELSDYLSESQTAGRAVSEVLHKPYVMNPTNADLEAVAAHYLIDEGVFSKCEDFPLELSPWLSPHEIRTLTKTQKIALVAVRAFHDCGTSVGFIRHLKVAKVFAEYFNKATRVIRFKSAISELCGEVEVIDSILCHWAAEKWGAASDFQWRLLDRGFRSIEAFCGASGLLYLYESCTGKPTKARSDQVMSTSVMP